jgi:transcriptional regulator with XRE-family HTH domain
MELTAAQCRAARGLIGWSQQQLATASKVAKPTIANFEAGKSTPYERTAKDLVAALEAAGVEFTNGNRPGVRLTRVGVLYQLADQANLDIVLKIKGMKEEIGHAAKAGKTPWTIARTPTGVECQNAEGTALGSVRVGDGGLIFDPDFLGSEYEENSPVAKLRGWIEFVMRHDAERHQRGQQKPG